MFGFLLQDGLAKSSRNVNLTEMERAEAPVIQQALKKGVLLFNEGVSVDEIEREITAYITENSSGIMDYISLLSFPELTEYDGSSDEAILACAVKFGKTRLIDNTIMSIKDGYYVQNDDEQ